MDVFIYTIVMVVILYLLIKNQSNKAKAYREGRESVIDVEYPYIVKGFHQVYGTVYAKYNFKDIEEAKKEAQTFVTEIGLDGRVNYEKAEIWYQGKLIQSYITSHRINIERVSRFSLARYNGEVRRGKLNDIDLIQISHYKRLTIKLTNGEVYLIEGPYYSIQDNCLRGSFITYLSEKSQNKSQEFECFPVNIIDKVVDYKLTNSNR